MEVKKGYKKTDFGVIPVDWVIKKLSDIGENITGLTYSPVNVKSYGTLVLRSSNIQDGKLTFDNNVYVVMDLPNRVIVKENDILICVRNGSKQLIGKCALITKNIEGSAFGAFMSIYRSKYSKFIFHQFQSNIIQRQINETLGATINQITNKDMSSFVIPFPPTDAEQTAIATALSDAAELISGLEKLIAKKRNIKQGAMQQLLTGRKRLPGFEKKKGYKQTEVGVIPEDWDVNKIANIVSITTGSKNTQDKIDDGQFPFFVRSQIVERINSFSYDGEAVLTAGDGVGTGKIFHYIKGKFDFHQRVYKLSDFDESLDGFYFYLYFSNYFYNRIMQMTAKSSVDSVRREMIADMHIPIPCKSEQTAIGNCPAVSGNSLAV